MTQRLRRAVVVVCHDSADELPATLRALRAQLEPDDEVVVVDNASATDADAVVRAATRTLRVLETGDNLGFAGGCHARARTRRGRRCCFFLNPDAVPAPGCVGALRAAAVEQPGWGAWQALVTLADGEHVNTAGNVVHWLGFGWAGGLGRARRRRRPAPAPRSGSRRARRWCVRREAWDATGGFDERYFMYGEDLDLSLRLRLAGWGIGVVPAARVVHDYAFVKGDYKWFWLERNRWWTVLGVYPRRLLAVIAPALLVFELVLLVAAWRGGWLRAKLRAQVAVLRSLRAILHRRRAIQATRVVSDRAFAEHLTTSLDSPYLSAAARVPGLRAAQAAFWRAARTALR